MHRNDLNSEPGITGVRASQIRLSIGAAVLLVVSAYTQLPAPLLYGLLVAIAILAWTQTGPQNVMAYLALLGVQVAVPPTMIDVLLWSRLAIADLFLMPVVVSALWGLMSRRRSIRTALDRPLLLLVAVLTFSTVWGAARSGMIEPYVWFNKGLGALFLIGGFYGIVRCLRSEADVRRAMLVFVGAAYAVNFAAIIATVVSVTVAPNPVYRTDSLRLYGWLMNPSSYGSFVGIMTLLSIWVWTVTRGPGRKAPPWIWASHLLLLVAVVLTASRAAYLAAMTSAVALLVVGLVLGGRRAWSLPQTATLAVAAFVPLVLMVWITAVQAESVVASFQRPSATIDDLQSRRARWCVANESDPSCQNVRRDLLDAERARSRPESESQTVDQPALDSPEGSVLNARGLADRLAILKTAWAMYASTPATMVLGIGTGTFFRTSSETLGLPLIIHNTPMWFLIELGPLGLIALLWLVGASVKSALAAAADTRLVAGLGAPVFAGFVFWVVFWMFSEAFYFRHFWVLMAFAEALRRLRRGESVA